MTIVQLKNCLDENLWTNSTGDEMFRIATFLDEIVTVSERAGIAVARTKDKIAPGSGFSSIGVDLSDQESTYLLLKYLV